MAEGSVKRKTFEQDSDGPSNPVREYKRYTYLQNVSHWKLFVFREKHSEDLRMSVLLNNADRYINETIAQLPSQGSHEPVPQLMFPNEIPAEETSWVPMPDRSALLEDLLGDLFPPTGEGLLNYSGMDMDSAVASPTFHAEADLLNSFPEALAANPEERSILDSLSQEELLCDSLLGSFEIMAGNYLQDLPLENAFADIDTSVFDSIPAPSNEPSQAACTSQEAHEHPQPEAAHLSDQDLSSGAELEHFMELLFHSE